MALVVICASFLLICRAAAAGEQSTLQVEVNPPSIQLAPGDDSDIVLIIKNSLPTQASAIRLKWFTDTGLTIAPAKPGVTSVAAGGTVGWPVHLATQKAGRTVGTLQFLLHYSRPVDGVSVPGVTVTSLNVQERAPLAIDKLVDGKLESAVDQLNEKHPVWMYLIITNRAATAVTVTHLNAHKPKFILLCVPDKKADPCLPDSKSDSFNTQLASLTQPSTVIPINSDSLPPQSSRVFPIQAEATNEARTGNERVVFEVGLEWRDAGQIRSGSVLIAQAISVGVFGESDILKLLGVPSFFMLPGFLALTTFGALWARVSPKKRPQPGLSLAELGLASVTLSLLAMLVYPRFTHRDYLQGYGLLDVMLVWFGSVMVGFFAWILGAGSINVRDRHRLYVQKQQQRREEAQRRTEEVQRQAEEMRRTPTPNDKPLQILEKLRLNGVSFPLEQAEVSSNGHTDVCFVILPAAPGRSFWVVPAISLTHTGSTKPTRDELLEELKKPDVLDNRENLTGVLNEAVRGGWEANWKGSGLIRRPTLLDTPNILRQRARLTFVEVS